MGEIMDAKSMSPHCIFDKVISYTKNIFVIDVIDVLSQQSGGEGMGIYQNAGKSRLQFAQTSLYWPRNMPCF